MYHLLRSRPRSRLARRAPCACRTRLQAGQNQPEAARPPEVIERARPDAQSNEAGEASEEAVYTVVGESVQPAEEATAITIVLDGPALGPAERQEGGEPASDESPGRVRAHAGRRLAPLGWSVVGVALALLGLLIGTVVLPWGDPWAIVTIVPVTQQVSVTLRVQVVPAHPDPARARVQGRQLAPLTLAQSATVPTTGHGFHPAQAAQGWVTLYNALPVGQRIPAGTRIIGQDGVQVRTETAVTIPAATPPIEGEARVRAQATDVGPAGNIAALDINGPCCRAEVLARNLTAFTGGQNARSFRAVSARDIGEARATLEARMRKAAIAAFQADLHDGERLLTPLSCQTEVQADPPQGSEAEQVTVAVRETCQGMAYDAAQMDALVKQAIMQHAQKSQAHDERLVPGSLHVQLIASSTQPTDVQVQVRAMLFHQWSEQQQRALAARIAGKREAEALALLAQQPGVAAVTLHLSGRDTGQLPTDPARIHVLIVFPEGQREQLP